MPAKRHLIADIGGTNARFALASDHPPYFDQSETLQCADFDNIELALDAYLKSQQIESIETVCFAVAAAVQNPNVRLTNNHWELNAENLRQQYSLSQVKLINDFEAIAYSLSQLDEKNLLNLGNPIKLDRTHDYTVAVMGPGTGLGAATLAQRGEQLIPLASEAGHTGFAPNNHLQYELHNVLKRKFDRVYNEQLVSGRGLVNIYESLCRIKGYQNEALTAADIATAGAIGSDQMCKDSLNLFFEILGQVTGDFVLASGAFQGAFIGGGICQRYPEFLVNSKFRDGFENKARQTELMRTIPTWLITHKNPGLLGSSVYARTYL